MKIKLPEGTKPTLIKSRATTGKGHRLYVALPTNGVRRFRGTPDASGKATMIVHRMHTIRRAIMTGEGVVVLPRVRMSKKNRLRLRAAKKLQAATEGKAAA